MEELIYTLTSKENDSDKYYNIIKEVCKGVKDLIIKWGDHYINDFMKFIKSNDIEKLRSKEEYSIEFMLIGVFIQEYVDNGRAFKNIPITPFNFLNNLRNKNKKNKVIIDKIRGKLATKVLLRRTHQGDEYSFNDFILLIKWLKATFEFKEEVLRLENWREFFKTKDELYVNHVLGRAIDVSLLLNDIGIKFLGEYTENVEKFTEINSRLHKNKEDIIYCTKGRIQYFFNMVSAEMMNQVYRERYLTSTEKIVFLPSCMRQTEKKCCSVLTNQGYQCKGCSSKCNVNIIHKLGEEKGFRVFVVEHENNLFNGNRRREIKTGIIGVACVLNLISGGWKAIRLGFIPQCVLLETCGCKAHWRKRDYMTNININKII